MQRRKRKALGGSSSGYVSPLALPTHQRHFSIAWRAYYPVWGMSAIPLTWMMCYVSLRPSMTTSRTCDECGVVFGSAVWNCKCRVRYLGRLVTSEAVQVDPKDLEAVFKLKERKPKNIRDVRSSLGFLGYYHTFIQDSSRIARPLFKLREYSDKSSQVTFIYIELLTIQIVSKQLHNIKIGHFFS